MIPRHVSGIYDVATVGSNVPKGKGVRPERISYVIGCRAVLNTPNLR